MIADGKQHGGHAHTKYEEQLKPNVTCTTGHQHNNVHSSHLFKVARILYQSLIFQQKSAL